MLNLVIAIIALIIWSSIVVYYFRTPLMHWFDNRFGKDTVLPVPEDDADVAHQGDHAPTAAPASPPTDKVQ
ncbi:hypothetical protein [Acetobacter orleanensis]|uniref:Uncharacterized protein n=1 Tax=Acetobacter orleanensis TaxID=104099 RepID=A0A4Y3TMC1_9PROT|nr:hypothetical protein [Acetobacter orleanensis]KXV64296.1 hypothetical protein AD949_06160 [Acetobacter orleanensis]PCD79079.1 hypothetical protein CO710_08685 [Acetobacter orleanensis]GAN69394.1 hypothetical protein Abol_034_021 [Acetobacter orleanensis JCM 7639]GBR22381.1 hypothetical protein AA0473_0108 [Acetobacter orleanensis NRIC 0473]GEB83002.1 hypothetical protein AOR01nite_14790 [Acetobacter orleanensis]